MCWECHGILAIGLKVYAEKTECSKIKNMEIIDMIVHVLLHLFNEMRKIDHMWSSANDAIIYQ